MAEKTTFIKIDRNIIRWRWFSDANTLQIFIWLIANANIQDREYQNITVHRGEVLASYASIAENTRRTIKEVRTAIRHLEETGEVASKGYAKFSVFSVLNYDYYQTKGQTRGKQILLQNCEQPQNGARKRARSTDAENPYVSGDFSSSENNEGQGNGQTKGKQRANKGQHLKNNKNIKNEKNKEKNKKESGAVSPLGGEPPATVEIEQWEKELMEQQGWSYDELLEWKNQ